MLLALLLSVAHAATLAGVTLADTATVAGQPMVLNGMGLREKYFVDVYVGGLYLPSRSGDPAAILSADAPKRMVMHFVYGKVSREQMVDSFLEDFGKQPGVAAQQANIDKLLAVVPAAVLRGEEIVFEYAPGTGTTMLVKGRPAATVAGADFMRMVFGIWLGPIPPTAALKAGLLGK
ncbi:MAG: chalcone isomerase family protein [Pseudomonadota bacterium]|nr:chalcone isomerase family protein [Pseudomonadota bacterium]